MRGFDESMKDDPVLSAANLLRAGIESYRAHDAQSAQIFFGLAEKKFTQSGDRWNARIARDWIEKVTSDFPSW